MLLTPASPGVYRERARRGCGVFSVQSCDLWRANFLLKHSVLRCRDVYVARIRRFVHHATRRDQVAVHGDVSKDVGLHLFVRALADADERCRIRRNVHDALVSRRQSRAVPSVDDDIAASAGCGRATAKIQRTTIARGSGSRFYCDVAARAGASSAT